MNTFCNKCGKKLEQDDKFCQFCGVKFEQLETISNIRKSINFSKKYFSEILFLAGVWLASYYLLLPPHSSRGFKTEYYTGEKASSILLIAIALVIGYKKYLEPV